MVTTVGNSFFISAQVGLGRLAQQAEDSAARIAGGKRILRVGDDAASVSIAARLQSQIFAYRQAATDTATSDTLVAVAKEGVERFRSKLLEAAEIAEKANSDTLIAQERAMYQKQLDAIIEDIDRIVEVTKFQDRQLLDGTFANEQLRVSAEENDLITIAISDLRSQELFAAEERDLSTQADAAIAENAIEDALELTGNILGALEGIQGQIDSASEAIDSTLSGINQAESAISDTDEYAENLALAQTQLKLDIGSAVIAQASRISDDLLNILEFKIELEPKPELNTSEEKEDDSSGEDTSEQSTGVNATSSEEAA